MTDFEIAVLDKLDILIDYQLSILGYLNSFDIIIIWLNSIFFVLFLFFIFKVVVNWFHH
jgi:hypothetical protein